MAITISNAGAGVMVSSLAQTLNDGIVQVHATTGTPANVEASAFGAVVVCARLADPAFAAFRDTAPGALVSANGLNIVTSSKTSGNLSPAYFRIFTSAGTATLQGTVTSAGGGGDMTVDNVQVDQDVQVNITTLTITQPES